MCPVGIWALVPSVRQLMELIDDVPDEHRGTNFCMCESCRRASDLGCTHPQRCLETARKLFNALAPKWRPEEKQIPRHEDPSPLVPNEDNQDEGITVNTAREATTLKHSIRIFTERENLLCATTLPTAEDGTQIDVELIVYTDGSCVGNGTDDARAGSGIWYGSNDPRNVAM